MADRFSRGPQVRAQFQETSLDELYKPALMAQQRADSNRAMIGKQAELLGSTLVSGVDSEYRQKLIDEYNQNIDNAINESGGDVAKATNSLFKIISDQRKSGTIQAMGERHKLDLQHQALKQQASANGTPWAELGNVDEMSTFDENGNMNQVTRQMQGYEKDYRSFQEQYYNNLKPSDLGSNWDSVKHKLGPNATVAEMVHFMRKSATGVTAAQQKEISQAYIESGYGQSQIGKMMNVDGVDKDQAIKMIENQMQSARTEYENSTVKDQFLDNSSIVGANRPAAPEEAGPSPIYEPGSSHEINYDGYDALQAGIENGGDEGEIAKEILDRSVERYDNSDDVEKGDRIAPIMKLKPKPSLSTKYSGFMREVIHEQLGDKKSGVMNPEARVAKKLNENNDYDIDVVYKRNQKTLAITGVEKVTGKDAEIFNKDRKAIAQYDYDLNQWETKYEDVIDKFRKVVDSERISSKVDKNYQSIGTATEQKALHQHIGNINLSDGNWTAQSSDNDAVNRATKGRNSEELGVKGYNDIDANMATLLKSGNVKGVVVSDRGSLLVTYSGAESGDPNAVIELTPKNALTNGIFAEAAGLTGAKDVIMREFSNSINYPNDTDIGESLGVVPKNKEAAKEFGDVIIRKGMEVIYDNQIITKSDVFETLTYGPGAAANQNQLKQVVDSAIGHLGTFEIVGNNEYKFTTTNGVVYGEDYIKSKLDKFKFVPQDTTSGIEMIKRHHAATHYNNKN